MSKTCEVCKRSYSEKLAACPLCAEVVELSDDDVVEAVQGGSDSAIDLGLPAASPSPEVGDRPGEGSGLSFVEWASLVEEKSAPPEPAAPVNKLPSPPLAPASVGGVSPRSDAPSAGAAEEEDALAGDLDAVRSIFAGDASASFSRQAPTPPPPAPISETDDSALDLLAVNDPEQAPLVEAVDSGIDMVGADLEKELVADALKPSPAIEDADSSTALAELQSLDSAVDLGPAAGADAAAPEELSGIVVADSAAEESGVLEDLPQSKSAGDSSGLDLSGDDIVIAAEDSGHLSGIEKNTPDTSESGRDLIAEEVESSVNMPLEQFKVASADSRDKDAVAGQLASEEEEVDLTEVAPSDLVDSSAVDLGASATFPAAEPEPASAPTPESPPPFRTKSQSIHGAEGPSPSEVNLGGPHDEPAPAEDFFDDAGGLSGSAVPLETMEAEASGLHIDEPTVGTDDQQPVYDEPEAVAEDEPERPAKVTKEKLAAPIGVGLGGAGLGAVLATGACLLLWFFNIEPPNAWRGAPSTSSGATTTTTNLPNIPAVVPVPFVDRAAAVRSGDLERAQKANIEAADESKAEEVGARGEYRVRNYLSQQSANKKPIEANDPTLQAGIKDLETAAKADDPAVAADALFYLGVTREASKDYDGALKAYKEGADRFKNDAAQKERFDAGVNRVAEKTAGATGRAEPANGEAALALLLTFLQAEEPAKPAATPVPAEPAKAPVAGEPAFTEAGSAFWLAVTKAREGKYDDALAAIKQASELHTRRRFTLLGKAQNPNSDPTEEIFLRSCEELKNYWELQKKLSTSGLPLVKGKNPAAAVDAVLAENKDLAEKVTKATTDAATQQKAVEAAQKDAEEAKKEADKTKKDLDAAQKDLLAAKVDLETKKKDLTAAEKNTVDLTEKLKAAEGAAAKEGEALKTVAAALTPKFLKPEAGEAALLPAVKEAARLAAVTDPQGVIHNLQGEATRLNSELKERWEPDQMLTFWMPLLQERGRNDLADKAIIDADRVLNDAKVTPENKARAHAVKGVALRNEEKYAAAKSELEQARANLPKANGSWSLETEAALKEASDPAAYFAAKAEMYRREGQIAPALAMLNRALDAAPPEGKARIVAERGALHLEQALAHGAGRAVPNDPELIAALKDADESRKIGGAEAFYLNGRIEEQLGRADEALQDYRQALKSHSALDADGARYRAAVARMLILPRTGAPAKVGKIGGAPGLDVLAALMVVAVQPGEFSGQIDPAAQEAVKLADEILSAKESDVPFEARAQAYAVKGLWTAALRTYVEGLRSSLSPDHFAGLLAIINGHPTLRRPNLMTVADPVEAEKHYAAGLRWYNDREFAQAEKEFFTAVEEDGQDARYYYYLGLAQLMQGDRDAFEDFEQGVQPGWNSRNESAGAEAAVSAAGLERVHRPSQGAAAAQRCARPTAVKLSATLKRAARRKAAGNPTPAALRRAALFECVTKRGAAFSGRPSLHVSPQQLAGLTSLSPYCRRPRPTPAPVAPWNWRRRR